MSALVDTSVLARLIETHSDSGAQTALDVERRIAAGQELCICAQVLIEFWVVATRPPEANGYGLDVPAAQAVLGDFLEMFFLVPEPPDIGERWRQIVVSHAVRGKQAHDARLVALMEAHAITDVLTLNDRDFRRYQSVKVIRPGSA